MSFRYFVYISDAKVEMLLQQIDPQALRKRNTEFGVELKVLTAKRGGEAIAGAERTARLERVVRYLTDFGDLGTVEQPGQFFWGMLPLRWGPTVGADGFPMVYFGARTGKTVLGLGGSRAHVFGTPPGADQQVLPIARSMLPSLLEGITRVEGAQAPESVTAATDALRGPAQNMEFIAKRLMDEPGPEGERVLLGSPLYVALVD
ncbi:hypothetical protein JIG36_04880 [Actinoplanes sp. LDG1-06]|uniref:Uncharacterized protein n=1 Tax=Paractinoplanes ovalisporus TaxID=2810368 RepID=A0ABS2A4Y0_9ACTN|nr:SAVMC3_10250 family protein [Actinoplanes ovalisporus]MBM2614891.1 hypothetical protein [Actinoplanes ovalisporus]